MKIMKKTGSTLAALALAGGLFAATAPAANADRSSSGGYFGGHYEYAATEAGCNAWRNVNAAFGYRTSPCEAGDWGWLNNFRYFVFND